MVTGAWRGPGFQVFDAHPRCAGDARHQITSAIAAHNCPVNPDDAATCITELFANAIIHGPAGGRVLVGYCLWREGARLVVCDAGGPGTPHITHRGPHDEGGRGLRLVESLTAKWGYFRPPGAQAVWCDFGEPLRAEPGDAWAWLHLVLSVCSLAATDRREPSVHPAGLAAAGAR